MVKDFVRDGMAWLGCSECGAETTIIKYKIVPQYKFPIIDHEATHAILNNFPLKHAICKKETIQSEMDFLTSTNE